MVRNHANITASLGLFSLQELQISSRLDPSFNILLPADFNRVSRSELSGFDNTGNVRLWPGGEALAAYLLLNPSLLSGKSAVELGSGLLGLPGITASRSARNVHITDGNEHSVKVVSSIISNNDIENVTTAILRWDSPTNLESFDVVLAADCIFFKDSHKYFLSVCDLLLSQTNDSFVMLCSPNRKGSLDVFIEFAKSNSQFSACIDEDFTDFLKDTELELDTDVCPILYLLKRIQ